MASQIKIDKWKIPKGKKGEIAVNGTTLSYTRRGGYSLNDAQELVNTVLAEVRQQDKKGYINMWLRTDELDIPTLNWNISSRRQIDLSQRSKLLYLELLSKENHLINFPNKRVINEVQVIIREQKENKLFDDV